MHPHPLLAPLEPCGSWLSHFPCCLWTECCNPILPADAPHYSSENLRAQGHRVSATSFLVLPAPSYMVGP